MMLSIIFQGLCLTINVALWVANPASTFMAFCTGVVAMNLLSAITLEALYAKRTRNA